ncbi:MAG: DeoR/GlpR family DNA-binding transcription regulator [Eubacteriales bacterium]|nr:DeoR/GlpR family DNA-binding transcription regulator [Eubacteriales bacterium]
MVNSARQDQIFTLLENHEKMSVEELANHFHVTETTIRRDLISMEEKQQIIGKRGYAILPDRSYGQQTRRRNTHQEEKARIAAKAFELFSGVHSMALDSGTTIGELVRHLVDQHSELQLQLVTCSLLTAYDTCRYFNTSIPGGIVFPDETSCGGPYMSDFFSNVTTDVAFLGSTGIANTPGLTVSYPPMLDVKRAMMACATKRVGLLDSSKFLTRGIYTFCTFDELDVLITVKTEENARALDEIAKHNVEIVLA